MSFYNIDGMPLNAGYDYGGDYLAAAYTIGGQQIFPDSVAIKVMTYNVQWFTKLNSQQAMQAAIINNNDADIIGLQEFSQNGVIPTVGANVLSSYPTIKLSNHKNYIAFASRLPLSNYVIADFANQDPEDMSRYNETRAYMVADCLCGGIIVKWINTHLAVITASYRWAQMGEILTIANGYIAQGYPVIITGDFNFSALSADSNEYTNMYKPFVDAGYLFANCSPFAGFTKTFSSLDTATSLADLQSAPDTIIVSPDISIQSVVFDTTKFSYLDGNPIDHIPVVATLQIGGTS